MSEIGKIITELQVNGISSTPKRATGVGKEALVHPIIEL